MLLSELCFDQPFYVVGNKIDKLKALWLRDGRVQCLNMLDGTITYLSSNTAVKPALDS